MKTITEFDGFLLKRALAAKKELTTAGKTPEELPVALGEALKLEGDKLKMLLHALEVIEARPDGIKRVIVYLPAEGEKAPSGAVAKEDKHMLAEYFFTQAPKQQGRDGGKGRGGPRDGKRGGGGKGRGKGGPGGGGGGRGGRDRSAPGGPGAGAGAGGGGERREALPGGERKAHPPRGPRPSGGGAPAGGKPDVKPNKVQEQTPKAAAPQPSEPTTK